MGVFVLIDDSHKQIRETETANLVEHFVGILYKNAILEYLEKIFCITLVIKCYLVWTLKLDTLKPV